MKSPKHLLLALSLISIVTFTQSVSAQTLLLQYNFNETGTGVINYGSASSGNLTMFNSGNSVADLHSASGLGVSGLSGDRSFSVGFGGARMGADNAAVDSLQRFTLTGWIFIPTGANFNGRIIDNQNGSNNGYYVSYQSAGTIGLAIGNGTTNAQVDSTASFTLNAWNFFAVTYDGSLSSANALFYRGTTSLSSSLLNTQNFNRGTPADDTAIFTVGNRQSNDRGLGGSIDNIRLYDGVLNSTQIEQIRVWDTTNVIPEPSTAALLVIAAGAALVLRRRRSA